MWVRLVPVPAGFRVLCFVGGIDVVLMGTVLSAAGVSGVFRVSAMHRRREGGYSDDNEQQAAGGRGG